MKKKFKTLIIFLISILIFISCTNTSKLETDDYYINLTNIKPKFVTADSSIFTLTKNNQNYKIIVLKRNKFIYNGDMTDNCVADQLSVFMKKGKTKNIILKREKINGVPCVIVSGTNYEAENNIYWTFAIFQTKYYFYILRISSQQAKGSFNENYHQKIITSFVIKK